MANETNSIREITMRARDGLKLFARHYQAPDSSRRPLLCLPGLTRNHRDFHDIASAISAPGPYQRAVYCIDYRGRGGSQWDSDWKNYAVPIEMLDVIDFLITQGLHDVAILGTSRGGLITMLLAAAQPTLVGPVILNDIGPVVETDGLTRIATFVGRIPLPRTWDEATRLVAAANTAQFPNINPDVWAEVAHQLFNEKDGRPDHGYDPELKNAMSVLDGPMPELWPQFGALTRVPLLVLRGENSDILSAKTVEEMSLRHPIFEAITISDEGHAPLLKDADSIGKISEFLAATDVELSHM